MPLGLPELKALASKAGDFAHSVLLPLGEQYPRGGDGDKAGRTAVIAASRDAGLFGLTQPEAFGGQDAGPLAQVVAREAIAAHNPRWLSAVFGPRPGVLTHACDELRESHLLPMMRGEKLGSFGFTEPGDAEHYTRAQYLGNQLSVTGRKSYVTRGVEADFVNVLADIEDRGRAFIVIDTSLPGVSRERIFGTIDGTQHAAFKFDGVVVPSTHLVGEPGAGMRDAMRQIGHTRLLFAAEASGLCSWVVNHVDARLRAVESHRGVSDTARLRYGELRILAYAVRATLYRAARRAQSGENAINEMIAAKAFATETLGQLIDAAMQIVGGSALMDDHPLAILYNEARVLRVSEGLTDVLRTNIARGALDLGKGTL